MNSMTGFGRGESESNGLTITVELKSVNHRFLDLSIRTPRQLSALEEVVRQTLKSRFARGRVDASVYCNFADSAMKNVSINMQLVESYLSAAKTISKVTGIRSKVSMAEILRLPEVISFEKAEIDEETIRPVLEDALNKACDALAASRKAEGQRISQDILARIDILAGLVSEIEAREPIVIEEYRQRLKAKLEEYLGDTEIDQNRFNQEILYFTDKANVTEEMVRLKSHFVQLRETLSRDSANGRSLDFIVQELNREFNTTGSKSSDLTVTNCVLSAKAEVEKIREQVQNIE